MLERVEAEVGIRRICFSRISVRLPIRLADWIAETGTESLAVYGQGTWSVGEQTDLIFGLRLNREEISHGFDNMLTAPNDVFLMGTDQFGRDLLTRIMYGARTALFVGFTAIVDRGWRVSVGSLSQGDQVLRSLEGCRIRCQ